MIPSFTFPLIIYQSACEGEPWTPFFGSSYCAIDPAVFVYDQ